jgi:hypothetical protein
MEVVEALMQVANHEKHRRETSNVQSPIAVQRTVGLQQQAEANEGCRAIDFGKRYVSGRSNVRSVHRISSSGRRSEFRATENWDPTRSQRTPLGSEFIRPF